MYMFKSCSDYNKVDWENMHLLTVGRADALNEETE
jgi:hypothetical protein